MHLFTTIIYFYLIQNFVNMFILPFNNNLKNNLHKKQTKIYVDKTNKEYSNHVNNIQKLESLSLKYEPKTSNQKYYKNVLENRKKKMIIVNGPAGTGKTLFACVQAIIYLEKKIVDKIVLTRPTIAIDKEDFGFLPGTLEQKMDPWLKPFFDILLTYYTQKEIDGMIYNQKLEICPLTYMRGRTFHNAFIIGDEMQNSTPHQMKTLATRIGSNSKLVILGDSQQSDFFDKEDCSKNGLCDLIERLHKNPSKIIATISLKHEDVQRSGLTKEVLQLYNESQNIIYITDEKYEKELLGKETILPYFKNAYKNSHNQSNIDNSNKVTKIKLTKITNDCAIIPLKHHSKYYPL